MKSRLKKLAEGEVIYIATAPVKFTEADDQSRWNIGGEEYFDELKAAVKSDMSDMDEEGAVGLAEYLNNDLKGLVTSIIVDVEKIGENIVSKTTVKAIRELTSQEIEKVKDYITGQFSDGWGEGFEQSPIDEYTTTETDYEDVEVEDGTFESEPYDYDVKIEVYAHFWQMENFNINITKI